MFNTLALSMDEVNGKNLQKTKAFLKKCCAGFKHMRIKL